MASTQTSPDGNYSFVVHSDPAMSSDLSSRLENPDQPKQKRRRTSPRDHAVLEAAYLKNSKPDKHERAEIVSQVELGEKEVQIWFQNRRQNDRRKSKPLQPHELLAHFRNGVPNQAAQENGSEMEVKTRAVETSKLSPSDIVRPSSRSSSIHELLNPTSLAESSAARQDKSDNSQPKAPLPTPPSSFEHVNRATTDASATNPSVHPGSTMSKEPSHSRKRSHEVMTSESNLKPEGVENEKSSTLPKVKALSRSSSFVRLAMTVDGAVKVRTNDEPTPSPPKQRTLPPIDQSRKRESFGRSQSAIENGFSFKDVTPPVRKIGGAGFGRSRDARTWEFYCDRDSGDALSTQAEAERSGSAIGAINLIRSRSQRNKGSALSPNPTKQNTRRTRFQQQQQHEKPKLSRAMSSMARLQSLDGATESVEAKDPLAKHARSPSGDSDKENWAPGTRTSRHNMRRLHPSAPRDSVLQENDFPSARDATPIRPEQGQENKNAGGREKAKGDDLDCIQGLLSLSQGAWQ